MKKFMKGAAITGGIFLLVGLIVFIIGAIGGGVRDIRQKYTAAMKLNEALENDDLSELSELTELEDLSELSELVDLLDGIEIIEGVNISYGFNSNLFDKKQEKYKEGTYTFENIDADEMEISVGAGQLEIKYHSEDFIKLEVGKNDQMQCFVEDNTVKIIGGLIKNNTKLDSDMTVYLPEGFIYDKLTIDVGAGSINADELLAENAVIDVGMGNVEISDMSVGTLEASVGMGNIEMQGSINEDAVVDCGMGQITMDIFGSCKDFNYELDCGMGSLSVEGVYNIAGIGEQSVENNATKDIEISCGMGNVEVVFSE